MTDIPVAVAIPKVRVQNNIIATKLCFAVFVLTWFVIGPASLFSQVRVEITPVAGPPYAANLTSVDESGMLSGEGFSENAVLDGLRLIRFNDAGSSGDSARVVVNLQGGSRLLASGISLAEEMCTVEYLGRSVELPIELLRGICFDVEQSQSQFTDGMQRPLSDYDKVFVRVDSEIQSVTAVVESINARQVRFLFEDQPRTMERDRIYGIVVADFGVEFPERYPVTVGLRNGSTLLGEVSSLSDGLLKLKVAGRMDLALPVNAIAEMRIKSNRLAYLSEEEPLKVETKPLVTLEKPWQRDRSVDGNPLTLFLGEGIEKQQYERGIGMHSYAYLEFANDRDFDRFMAIIGIDAETNGRGDCVFKVIGDGTELFTRRVKGSDEPFEVDLDISGVQRLALVVEPGEDLDLGDHANWCEARMLRTTR